MKQSLKGFRKMSRLFSKMFLVAVAGLAAASQLATLTNSAQAGWLGSFPSQEAPDLFASVSSIAYNAATDTFAVTGTPISFDLPNNPPPPEYPVIDGPKSYTISAVIDSLGNFVSGTLSVTGKIPAAGANSGLLLQGTLEAFGFDDNPFPNLGVFQLVFGNLSGDLAPHYSTNKAYVLISTYHPASGYTGSFENSFTFVGTSQIDSWGIPVPEPTSATLFIMAGFGLSQIYRRRARAARVS
jgi:hypothetical protein